MPKPPYEIPPRSQDTMVPYTDEVSGLTGPRGEMKNNVRVVGHSDLGGWGDAFQIQVRDGICYVAASGANGHNGMTILDVSDPSRPKVVKQIEDRPSARTHKILLVEDVLYTNREKRPGVEDPEVIGGLRIFDVRDPKNPKYVNSVKPREEAFTGLSMIANGSFCTVRPSRGGAGERSCTCTM